MPDDKRYVDEGKCIAGDIEVCEYQSKKNENGDKHESSNMR